jgi:hypothetical protein
MIPNDRYTVRPEDLRAARLSLTRDAWDAALLAGDVQAADRYAAEVSRLENINDEENDR